LEAQVKATPSSILLVIFIWGAIFSMLTVSQSQQPDPVAAPTQVCIVEMVEVAGIFLAWVIFKQPAEEAIGKDNSSISRFLRLKVKPPIAVRGAAIVMFIAGSFGFAFWATADVLGRYKGYGYSFNTHPILRTIYDRAMGLVPYVTSLDKGTQASIYFAIGVLGLSILLLNRGIGAALKNTLTLYVAPCLIVFEIALWNYAPEDMTWHVTDFLWMGGTADGGFRALDKGGAFLFSNWLVLCVALVLVASRVPWLSLPSMMIWRREVTESP